MPANLIITSVYTSLHEEVVLGCSKHIQMAQNVFPTTQRSFEVSSHDPVGYPRLMIFSDVHGALTPRSLVQNRCAGFSFVVLGHTFKMRYSSIAHYL